MRRRGLLNDDVNEMEDLIMICQEQLNRPPRVLNVHTKVTSVHRNSVIRREDRESRKLIKITRCLYCSLAPSIARLYKSSEL